MILIVSQWLSKYSSEEELNNDQEHKNARTQERKKSIASILLVCFFPAIAFAVKPPEIATSINTKIGVERREQAELGFGKSALVDASTAKFNFGLFNQKKPTPDLLVAGRSFRLRLPGEKKPELFHIESVQEHVPGVYTYTGYLGGNKGSGSNIKRGNSTDNYSWFSFSVKNQQLLGKINHRGYAYVVQKDNQVADDFIISKIDPRKIPHAPDVDDEITADEDRLLDEQRRVERLVAPVMNAAVADDGSRNIRVYFLFTNDVSQVYLKASQVISEYRHALSNSGISLPHRYITFAGLRYAGGNTDDYSCTHPFDDSTRANIRNAMGDAHASNTPVPGNPFNGIKTWMADAQADIAFLIFKGNASSDDPNFCRVGGVARILNPVRPVAVSADNYALADYTALHEIGHIFDGRHVDDSSHVGEPGLTSPEDLTSVTEGGDQGNQGFLSTDGTFQTIMGDYTGCTFAPIDQPQTQTCERRPRFSDGGTFGSSDQNMVAWINSSDGGFAQVAAWGAGGSGSPPLAPNPFSITDYGSGWWCYKNALMTARPNATYYQLYVSLYSNFSNHSLIYSGSSTTPFIWQTGTKYYRAKACNTNGCGNFTPKVTAFPNPGC